MKAHLVSWMVKPCIVFGAVLAICACIPATLATSVADNIAAPPVAHADKIVLDEQVASSAELLYKGFRIGGKLFILSGKCTGHCAQTIRTINIKAFKALGTVRSAYKAVNATSYQQGYDELISAIAEGTALIAQSKGNH